MREEQINPAGVFLRTLRESPGAQSAAAGEELPIKQALLALREGSKSRDALSRDLAIARGLLDETLRNLYSLDLIESTGLGKQETVSLTTLGEKVAEKS
jgi:hypothetical protein